MSTAFVLVVFLILLILSALQYASRRRRYSRLPPGPAGLPVLGNILELPSSFLYRQLHTWRQKFGPLYTFWIAGQPFLVVGDVKTAADILDRQSGVTSRRPNMIKARDFYVRNSVVQGQDHTLLWRANRFAIHANFNIRATARFAPMQEDEAAYLTLGLLQHPTKPFHEHTHRYAASVIYRSLYGGNSISHSSVNPIKNIEDLLDRLVNAADPAKSVVDILPFLKPVIERSKWLRGHADQWFGEMNTEALGLWKDSKQTEGWKTVASDLNARADKYGLSHHDSVWLAVSLYAAGQETTDISLKIFTLAMLHNLEAMRAAQQHIDAVCATRPPTFTDKGNLPYVQAIVLETLRWIPSVANGLMHMAAEDFTYDGYVIPKGTIIVDNLWSQTRDETVYSCPETFDPTRFLDNQGHLRAPDPDTHQSHLPFGHGRRVCPGKDFALDNLFIACAYLLWAFDFEWPRDEQGEEVKCAVDEMVDRVLVVGPRPFDVVLKPRQEGLEERLTAAWNE